MAMSGSRQTILQLSKELQEELATNLFFPLLPRIGEESNLRAQGDG